MKSVVGALNKYKDAILLGELNHNSYFSPNDAGPKPAGLHNSLLDPSNLRSDLWSAFNFLLLL